MIARILTAMVAAAVCAMGPPAAARPRPGPAAQEVALNGARVWYRTAGDWSGDVAPVVFLAGGPGGNSHAFSVFAGPALERRLPVVYYDQRGTGRSERPATGDYALATLVSDIEALRAHLGAPRVTLMAHSFGAVLALEYAARHPERVARLVLIGPLWNAPASCRSHLPRMRSRWPDLYAQRMQGRTGAEDDVCERSFRIPPSEDREAWSDSQMFPREESRLRFERVEAESGLRNTGELSQAVFAAGLLRYRFSRLPQVTAPTLVVAGREDHAAGLEPMRELARRLPNGRIVEYENVGHWVFVDDPDRFARDVVEFLGR